MTSRDKKHQTEIDKAWGIFDALTCEHPMLADIEWWMTPPFPEYMILELREQQLNKKEVKSDD